MQKWEYLTTFVTADVTGRQEKLKQLGQSAADVKFSPVALMPELNAFGERGWEIVSMEPVSVGSFGDIMLFPPVGLQVITHEPFTHTYLCTFKRPKVE